MGWRTKQVRCAGSALFRGSMPPRAENFAYLERRGFRLERQEPAPGAHWCLMAEHPTFGRAMMVALRNMPRPPAELIDWDPRLTREERQEARAGHAAVSIAYEVRRGDVLRDRKNLLRFLGAVLGDDGVVAIDHASQRFWSRAALDDELAHDADLDVEGIFTLHAVTDDRFEQEGDDDDDDDDAGGGGGRSRSIAWLHSHGLAEVGAFDFDILNATRALTGLGTDLLRVLAFAIVEGTAKPTTPRLTLARPGGEVRLVDVGTFNARADPAVKALRIGAEEDDSHNQDRCVVCEPAGGRLTSLLGLLGIGAGGRVEPSRFCSSGLSDGLLFRFSDEATELMGERARKTLGVMAALREELAEFDFPVLAKLGYTVDGAAEADDREHLWFKVHGLADGRIDGELLNEPVSLARFRVGQRDWHDAALLTDWTIITPIGWVTPRDTRPARSIRARRDEFRALMQEHARGRRDEPA